METKLIFWFIFILINFIIAIENRNERNNHIATGNPEQVNHTAWAIAYCAACGLVAVFNWKLSVSVLFLHASLFPVFYNLLTHASGGSFGISRTTTSVYDKFLIRIGLKDALVPNLLTFTISLLFLWLA
jgi:hypothetical protein